MLRLFRLLVVCLVLTLVPRTASGGEVAERQGIYDAVKARFLAGDYRLLDDMAERFRSQRERTRSGVFKLAVFYDGFAPIWFYGPKNVGSFDRALAGIDAWIELYPDSPTARLVRAQTMSGRAWFRRGSDYSSLVPSGVMERFGKENMDVFRYLLSIRSITSTDPTWYEIALGTATLDPSSIDYDAVEKQALATYPDFDPLHFSMVTHYLPIWGGSEQRLYEALRRVADTIGGPQGDVAFARAYWYAAQSFYRDEIFWKNKDAWPQARRGFEQLVKDYPSQWNLKAFFKFACFAGDKKLARRLATQVGGGEDHEVLDDIVKIPSCVEWANSEADDLWKNLP